MFDVKEYRAALALAGMTQRELAAKIGISETALCRKVRRGVFRTDEAYRIVEVLHIRDPRLIFFAETVTSKDTI